MPKHSSNIILLIVGATALGIIYLAPKGDAQPLKSVPAQAKACSDLDRAIAAMYREAAAEDFLVELEKKQ